MAPTLTSNCFLVTTPPPSKAAAKSVRPVVFAKLNSPFPSFRVGKREDDSDAQPEGGKVGGNGFVLDFGKIPDMKSLVPVVSQPSTFGIARWKDARTVFVAGATGQAGVRIAQMLLRQGFAVRAGVPELAAAQELARLAAQYKLISTAEFRRLNAVESGFQDAESIAKAIGNAAKVVVTIGPGENGPTSPLTISDALKVVQAAQLAGVGHVAVVYDNSSTSPASTYNVLDGITTFFSNLFAKSEPLSLTELLQEIVQTDIGYTVIKASLADDFSTEYSGNVVVAAEGSRGAGNEYKVSKSQIAELVAGVFSNTSVAENKVVEVSIDPSASSKPAETLFSIIPEDGRRKAYAEAVAKAKAEEEAVAATEKARAAAEAAKRLEEEVKNLTEKEARAAQLAEEAEEKAKAAGSAVENLRTRAKIMSDSFSWDKLSAQLANSVSIKMTDLPKPKIETQIATVRGQARARNLTPKKAVVKRPAPPKSKPKEAEVEAAKGQKAEVRSVFGGLFKQETIYVDDD